MSRGGRGGIAPKYRGPVPQNYVKQQKWTNISATRKAEVEETWLGPAPLVLLAPTMKV